MTVLLLHLSDIHIKGDNDPILKQAASIASCTFGTLPDASKIFVVISGDIAYSGKAEQYACASTFLTAIKTSIQTEQDIAVHFIISPGNHDCDFDRDNKMRQMAIKCLNDGSMSVDDSVIEQCTSVQDEFFKFKDGLMSGNSITGDRLWETRVFEIEGKSIVFDAFNVSWVSRIHEVQGGVVFPHERYVSKKGEAADVRIIVMHHPLNWFNQGSYRPFRQFVRKLANILVTGHEHQANVGENIDSESSSSAYIEGDTLQDAGGLANSAFNLVTLNLKDGVYKSTRFAWKSNSYEATEEGSWADYRELPAKRRNAFEIQKEFRRSLDDPGANFRNLARSSVSLSDIYIYPDLLEAGIEKRAGNFLSSSMLRDPAKTALGVLLEGEDKVGCTSLLYRLYDEYHERGFAPLFVKGANFKKITPKELDQIISKAVTEQYGKETVSGFEKLSKSKKILLLDDFDDGPAGSVKDRANVLCALRKRFAHMVITVGMFFEVRELLRETESSDLSDFAHYQVQPFGYSLRGKLIRKWSDLCNDGTMDEAALLGKYDQAEKAMDAIMGRNIIPSMPLYLLTLLQSIEAGRSGEFKDSALGHYYEYLLTEGLLSARTPRDKLTEYFDYCTELAWFFHIKCSRELNVTELSEFNQRFSSKWHTVDFNERLDRLVLAKVLIGRGDYYAFRYPYIYYFLKGRYLSRNISDIQIREYVEKCCAHLYVREHANTVLFLAHHTSDEFVMETILGVLRSLFKQHQPVTFVKDTDRVSSLINDAGKLKYSGTPPEEFREQVNETRDELDSGNDGLIEKEEMGEGLSLIAQLITLFKTVEILGQVLKNQYSSIERSRKVDVLEELFCGPMRALAGYYELITENPDLLVAEIDSVLKHHHKLKEVAERVRISKQIVGRLVQITSLGFICKASSSVSAEALREDIHSAVKRNNTPAFRLIELGVMLDSASPIPREALLKLKEDTVNEVIPSCLMHMFIVRHLYMFRTSEQDKQWLASKFGLDLFMQHAVDFRSAKTKRINK